MPEHMTSDERRFNQLWRKVTRHREDPNNAPNLTVEEQEEFGPLCVRVGVTNPSVTKFSTHP